VCSLLSRRPEWHPYEARRSLDLSNYQHYCWPDSCQPQRRPSPQLKLDSPRNYTDSQVALYWICGQGKLWKLFIQNRLNEIAKLNDKGSWRHCPGKKTLWVYLLGDSHHLSCLLEHCGDVPHCGWESVMICRSLTQLTCPKIVLWN
jgi:hypothetical protein